VVNLITDLLLCKCFPYFPLFNVVRNASQGKTPIARYKVFKTGTVESSLRLVNNFLRGRRRQYSTVDRAAGDDLWLRVGTRERRVIYRIVVTGMINLNNGMETPWFRKVG